MSHHRPRKLLAATLLAAGTLLLIAVATDPAGAATGSLPALMNTSPPTPSASSTGPVTNDPPPTPSGSALPPGQPGDFRVTAVTTTSVTLAWTASAAGASPVAGYDISYNQSFDDIYRLYPAGNVTTLTITEGIRATGQYTFRISARDTVGRHSTTNGPLTVITPASDTAADRTPPSVTTGVTVSRVSPSSAAVSWTAATDDVGVTGYQIYRFDGLFVNTLVGTATGTSATVPVNEQPNMIYVRARDAAGNLGAVSAIATVPAATTTTPPTTPPAPTCSVTYRTGAQWTGGFVAEIRVTNTGAVAVDGWQLAFRFGGDQKISHGWGATVNQAGADVTLTGLTWNRTIAAGAAVTAGIMGTYTSSAAAPTAASLNGAACAVA
jgi:cellulose binding protein with CBM2 domain/fibronectin type III domain protein